MTKSSYHKQLEKINGNPGLELSEEEAEKIIFRFSGKSIKIQSQDRSHGSAFDLFKKHLGHELALKLVSDLNDKIFVIPSIPRTELKNCEKLTLELIEWVSSLGATWLQTLQFLYEEYSLPSDYVDSLYLASRGFHTNQQKLSKV